MEPIMESVKEIRKGLSKIYSNLDAEVDFFLSSITEEQQLDAAVEWLKLYHPQQAPEQYDVTCLKQGIKKWGNIPEDHFSVNFKSKFPYVAEKLISPKGNMLIFLRVTNILGSIPVELLAEIIEPIIKARKIEKKELYTVKIEKSSQHTSIFSMLATSPQPYIQAFRYAFFPGLKQGGETSEKIYFDWRLAKERKKNPIR